MAPSARLRVQQDPDLPIEQTVLAGAIVQISEALVALRKSGLNERGILALLHDKTGITKKTLKSVLDGMAQLRQDYCR